MKEIKEYYSKIVHHLLTEIDNTQIDNAQDIDIVNTGNSEALRSKIKITGNAPDADNEKKC